MRVAAFAAVAMLSLAATAGAHPLDLGYLRVETTGSTVTVELELDANEAAIVLGIDAGALEPSTIATRAHALADGSFGRAPITTAQGACRWTGATATMTGRTVKIGGTAECDGSGVRTWTFPLVSEGKISSRFQLMVKETVGDSERLTLIDKTTPRVELSSTTSTAHSVGFKEFVWSGIEHIGVAPDQWHTDEGFKLPDGIDHIMFLLALMLCGGSLLQLVGIASGFTLGHSITLALAALDIVRPPASVIEPLIALSIALAAVEAFSSKLGKHRWKIATGFGFVHGFGFATALSHLELTTRGKITALFGYNFGVEIGQVVVVLVVAPLVMLAYRHPRTGTPIIRVAAGLIFLCGMYWFVKRAFL